MTLLKKRMTEFTDVCVLDIMFELCKYLDVFDLSNLCNTCNLMRTTYDNDIFHGFVNFGRPLLYVANLRARPCAWN